MQGTTQDDRDRYGGYRGYNGCMAANRFDWVAGHRLCGGNLGGKGEAWGAEKVEIERVRLGQIGTGVE